MRSARCARWLACPVSGRSRSTDPQPPRPPNRDRERERVCGITRAPWPISSHGDVGAGHELHTAAAHGQTICSRETGYVRLLHERRSGVQCPRRPNLQHVQGTLPAWLPVPVNDGLTAEPRGKRLGIPKKKWITRQISARYLVSLTHHLNRTPHASGWASLSAPIQTGPRAHPDSCKINTGSKNFMVTPCIKQC